MAMWLQKPLLPYLMSAHVRQHQGVVWPSEDVQSAQRGVLDKMMMVSPSRWSLIPADKCSQGYFQSPSPCLVPCFNSWQRVMALPKGLSFVHWLSGSLMISRGWLYLGWEGAALDCDVPVGLQPLIMMIIFSSFIALMINSDILLINNKQLWTFGTLPELWRAC